MKYALLDEAHLAVVQLATPSPMNIQIFRYSLLVEDLLDSAGSSRSQTRLPVDLEPLCSLQLPPHKDDSTTRISVTRFTCNTHRPATPPEPAPFHLDDRSGVLSVQLWFGYGDRANRTEARYALLIPLRTIRREIAKADASGKSTALDWIDWGIHGSVLLHLSPGPAPNTPQEYEAFGHRYGMLVYDNPPSPRAAQVAILDFSLSSTLYHRGSPGLPNTTAKNGEDPLVQKSISQGAWEDRFAAPVRSTLPYEVIMGPRVVLPERLRYISHLLMQPDGFTLVVSAVYCARLLQVLTPYSCGRLQTTRIYQAFRLSLCDVRSASVEHPSGITLTVVHYTHITHRIYTYCIRVQITMTCVALINPYAVGLRAWADDVALQHSMCAKWDGMT